VLESKAGFNNSEKFFYLLITFTVVAILFTDPFLKYPYDMFTHLQCIDEQSNVASPERKYIWHYIWGQFFNLFHIDQTHIFLRAQIIHYIQSISIFIMIFYTSKIFMKNLFIKISSTHLIIWDIGQHSFGLQFCQLLLNITIKYGFCGIQSIIK